MTELFQSEILLSTLRLALPMIFAVLGGLLSERSGTAQIGLEGMMLAGALFAASVTSLTGSPWLGLGAAVLVGASLGLLMSFFVILLGAEHIIVGTALNLFVFGFAPFLTKVLFDSTGTTPAIPLELRMNVTPYILLVLILTLFLHIYHRTQVGLWIRFAGENPKVLTATGISVKKVRCLSLLFCGMLAGLGGATLTLSLSSAYSPMMTAGRGFMALAAIIFGGWRPLPALLACLFFALTDAIQIRLQGTSTIPVQFIQILPYAVTIVALAGFYRKGRPPQSIGVSGD